MEILIRGEKPADEAVIHDITARAFAPMPYSDGDEQQLIDRFRNAGALELSLVAEQDGAVVGQVTFTRAFAADGSTGWYALGPVAVEPELQSQRIGQQLIEAGLAELRNREAAGCILVGNPEYYQRFGFQGFPELCPDRQPADYFQILPLGVAEPDVVIEFHPLFYAEDDG
ncbi:putative acetyltransferase [Parasphingorhabdus marina DSM 22363]|uniref:Putative acetyltransferase n=1 Tax=Parasphingorhabdus marina DSM 22363 TaxID=1123272 RepID=A0A1N6EMB1_9SPHN|nr:N-acetyltransferase [Parasphingorhabdus marina]SIN84176.1 putative acetyltransferase [Parasphingorhabdus marina DSM 22363]